MRLLLSGSYLDMRLLLSGRYLDMRLLLTKVFTWRFGGFRKEKESPGLSFFFLQNINLYFFTAGLILQYIPRSGPVFQT